MLFGSNHLSKFCVPTESSLCIGCTGLGNSFFLEVFLVLLRFLNLRWILELGDSRFRSWLIVTFGGGITFVAVLLDGNGCRKGLSLLGGGLGLSHGHNVS